MAEIAAPAIERFVNLIKTAVSATRRIAVVHWVSVLLTGLPSEVRHADDVWTSERVTALTAIILTRLTRIVFSPSARDAKISLTASGANANRTTDAGSEIAKVISIDL